MVSHDRLRDVRPRQAAQVVGLLVAAAVAVGFGITIADHGFIDLDVYRAGGRAFLDGAPLYGSEFAAGSPAGLRFIYAPFAAALFVPFTLMPADLAHGVWTVITVLLVLWVLHAVCSRLGVTSPPMPALVLLAPALLLEPVRETVSFGQVNVVMVALVVLDATGVIPKRFRGIGIGIAAAVKVTPAAFGLLLLVRRDYASIVRAAGAFLACAAIGYALDPADSTEYWTSVFFDSSRAGGAEYGPNQAITGLLARLGLEGTTRDVVWLLACAVIVPATAWAAYRFTRAGEHVLALSVVALASLLCAPFAVSHHWSYVVLLLPLLAARQYAAWRYPIGAAAIVFSLGAVWFLPIGEDLEHERWSWLDQLTGNSECLAGIALMVGAVVVARRRTPRADARPPEETEVTALAGGAPGAAADPLADPARSAAAEGERRSDVSG